MCPTDMQPYIDAHEIELDERDTYVYLATCRYGIEMLSYTIDHALNGTKAKTKLNEQTIREFIKDKQAENESQNQNYTQEEILEATKDYFRQRKIDKLNFDLMQIEKRKSEG